MAAIWHGFARLHWQVALTLSSSPSWSEPPKEESGKLLVANKGDHTLGIIDPVANRQTAVVPENGVTGHEVIVSSDGKIAYVAIYGNPALMVKM